MKTSFHVVAINDVNSALLNYRYFTRILGFRYIVYFNLIISLCIFVISMSIAVFNILERINFLLDFLFLISRN